MSETKTAEYEPIEPTTPPLVGLRLRLAAAALEWAGGWVWPAIARAGFPGLLRNIRRRPLEEDPQPSALLDSWDDHVDEVIVPSTDAHVRLEAALRSLDHAGVTPCATASNARPTVLDYHYCYEHGLVTPNQVAERIIAFVQRHNASQAWLATWSPDQLRAQAAESSARYAAGRSLSVFDGVPFCVKDCIDATPYPTSYGTAFMHELHKASADAPAVAELKSLGAVLLGKAAMNEFGAFGHGLNARSLCGVAGLKPSKGRLADDHGACGGYSSVIESGPIANSIPDLALLYAVMANVDYAGAAAFKPRPAAAALPGVPAAAAAAAAAGRRPLGLPRVLLPLPEEHEKYADQQALAELQPLAGLRVGVFKQWSAHCSAGVADVLRLTGERLEALGAALVEVALPELDLVQAGHVVTFLKEQQADGADAGWLHDWSRRYLLNPDTRLFFANAACLTGEDYLQAQRMRARALAHFKAALAGCDVIMTPATPCVAPELPAGHEAGAYDMRQQFELIRFTQAASLTGLPALVMPAGRLLSNSLPVGVQFIGKPWAEATLLRTAAALEQHLLELGVPRPVPGLLLNPVQCEKGAHPKARALTKVLWSKRYG